jgi:hypothetical protein
MPQGVGDRDTFLLALEDPMRWCWRRTTPPSSPPASERDITSEGSNPLPTMLSTHGPWRRNSLHPARRSADSSLTFMPGAFVYRGLHFPLKGKPLEVLRALAEAHERTCTASDLLQAVWPEAPVEEDTVRSAVSDVRKAVRKAMEDTGISGPDDPIPAVDRGTGRLAWRLDLP